MTRIYIYIYIYVCMYTIYHNIAYYLYIYIYMIVKEDTHTFILKPYKQSSLFSFWSDISRHFEPAPMSFVAPRRGAEVISSRREMSVAWDQRAHGESWPSATGNGKTIGKPWENHGKTKSYWRTIGKPSEMGSEKDPNMELLEHSLFQAIFCRFPGNLGLISFFIYGRYLLGNSGS